MVVLPVVAGISMPSPSQQRCDLPHRLPASCEVPLLPPARCLPRAACEPSQPSEDPH